MKEEQNNESAKPFILWPHIIFCTLVLLMFVTNTMLILPSFVEIYEDLGAHIGMPTKIVFSSIYLPVGVVLLLFPTALAAIKKKHFILLYFFTVLALSVGTVFSVFIPLIGTMDSIK